MKHLFVLLTVATGVVFASCGSPETTSTATNDSTVVAAAAPADTTACCDSTATAVDSASAQ